MAPSTAISNCPATVQHQAEEQYYHPDGTGRATGRPSQLPIWSEERFKRIYEQPRSPPDGYPGRGKKAELWFGGRQHSYLVTLHQAQQPQRAACSKPLVHVSRSAPEEHVSFQSLLRRRSSL